MTTDPRVAELQALALDEGLRLPMPAEMIVWFETRGKIVDLVTGRVYASVTVQPTSQVQAIVHLLQDHVGDL